MMINNFIGPINQAEQRYREHTEVRRERRRNLQSLGQGGDWRKVDDPERIAQRLKRLGLPTSGAGLPEPVLLERILGSNDLITTDFLIRGAAAARSVGRIVIRSSQDSVLGYGTGFLVSPSLLMTNNHVLKSPQAAANSLVQFNYRETLGGALSTPYTFHLQPERFFRTYEHLDFTLVAVAARSAEGLELRSLGWNRLIAETGKILVGERVNIIQHPGGKPQQLALRMNQISDLLDDFLHYSADTERGSSGSPVFNDQWELVSLHHAGVPRRDQDERILLVSGDPWDGSDETFEQIDWKANEGARISRIVTYLNAQQPDFSAEERLLYQQAFSSPAEELLEAVPALDVLPPVPEETAAPVLASELPAVQARPSGAGGPLRSIPFEVWVAENGEVGLYFPAGQINPQPAAGQQIEAVKPARVEQKPAGLSARTNGFHNRPPYPLPQKKPLPQLV